MTDCIVQGNDVKKYLSDSVPPLLLNGGLTGLAFLLVKTTDNGWSAVALVLLVLIAGIVANTAYAIRAAIRKEYRVAFLYLLMALVAFVLFLETHIPGKIGG